MKPLEVWTCQRAENLKKKLSKIQKNNYAATMVSAARRKLSAAAARRSTKVGGGANKLSAAAARPAHGSTSHISDPPFSVVGPTKTRTKTYPCIQISLKCSLGFCLEGFVWGGFCLFPLLSEPSQHWNFAPFIARMGV